MNKTQLIKWLIEDDIDTILTGDRNDYLDAILRDGFCGYRNQSLKELMQEYNERKPQ